LPDDTVDDLRLLIARFAASPQYTAMLA
jgi:hypothetical protein